ncbi:S8 family serine peptidase, partial [Halorubrum tibetense]
MVVSMLAPTAGAAAAMGATSGDAIDVDTSDIQTDAQFDVDENTDTPDTDRSGELRAHHESDDTDVHPALRDATGDTVVLVSVERELGSVAGLSAADANVTKALMEDTAATQAPVIEALEAFDAEVRSEYWAGNVVSAEVDLDRVDVEEIAAIDGVARVSPNLEYERPAPQMDAAEPDLDGDFTFGLEQINVPEFDEEFDGMGDGASVVIGDDGISNPEEGHPDLEFAEEVNVVNGEINEGLGSPGAHGEHVAGTATGAAEPVGDVPRFGVAPNADLLKANVFEGGAFTEDIIASMEWAAEEDADVASYSLGFAPEGDGSTFAPAYVDTIEDVNAAGTAAVVSAGNEGAGDIGGPVTAPATNFDSVAVGASTEAGDIATFSSGAVIDDGSVEFVGGGDSLPETFPRQYVQPDVSAPGADVLSAGPLGGDIGDPAATYSYASGTSMAAPHYAGAVALLQSVTDEQLEPEAIENALAETAEKPENDFAELNSRDIRYGTGIIDVHAAAQALTGDEVQTIEGTVTDAETGEPLVGATVESAEGALTSTDDDGEYTLTVTSDPAEITADEFGFAAQTVEVSGGEETDFALEPATSVELVQDQPQFVTPGDEFEIVVDVRNVETLTLEITEESTTDPEDVTVSLDGDELPFGEPIDLGGLNADGVTLDVAVDEDAELDTEFAIEHTFGDEDDDPPAEDAVGFGDGEFLFAPGQTDTVTMNTSADDVAGYEVFVDFEDATLTAGQLGDVNNDGEINAFDAILIQQ